MTNTNNTKTDRAARLAADLAAHRAAKQTARNTAPAVRYFAAVHTAAKYAADLAARDAATARNAASKAATAARKADSIARRYASDTAIPVDRRNALCSAATKAAATAAAKQTAADIAAAHAADLAAADDNMIVIMDTTATDSATARRTLTDRAAGYVARGILPAVAAVRIYRDITDPGQLTAAAADIARRTAKNAVCREGTEKQWTIYNAAAAREYDNDLADIQAAAALALSICSNGAAADADAMTAAADLAAATPRAELTDMTDVDIRNAERGTYYADIIRARLAGAPGWLMDAYHAAYIAVNDHLTDCRSIRNDTRPAPLSLDDMDIADYDRADTDTDPADIARADRISTAVKRAYYGLTPTRATVWRYRAKGYTMRDIAATMRRDRKTIAEHIDGIRKHTAAVMLSDCPDIAAAILSADIIAAAETYADRAAAATERADATAAAAAALQADPAATDTQRKTADKAADRAATAAADATAAAKTAATAADALTAAVATLSPIRRKIWKELERGQNVSAAAAAVGRSRATVREHIAAIRRILSDAVRTTSPELADAMTAADLADVARMID